MTTLRTLAPILLGAALLGACSGAEGTTPEGSEPDQTPTATEPAGETQAQGTPTASPGASTPHTTPTAEATQPQATEPAVTDPQGTEPSVTDVPVTDPQRTPTPVGPTEPQATDPAGTEPPTPTSAAPSDPPAATPTAPDVTLPPGVTPSLPPPTPTASILPQCGRTVMDLQDASRGKQPANSAKVRLCNVRVTAIDVDGLFVGDPVGGAYSGIYIYAPEGSAVVPEGLAVGDEVDVQGTFNTEVFGVFNQIGLYDDEIVPPEVLIRNEGAGVPPATVIRTPATIATRCTTGTTGPAAIQYEGVRVRVLATTVTNDNPCDLGRFGVFETSGNLLVDDDCGMLYDGHKGDDLATVTGVLHWRFDYFRLFPGPNGVVVAGGTPAPTQPPPTPTMEPTPVPTPTAAPTPPPTEPGALSCTEIYDLKDVNSADHPDLGGMIKVCGGVVTAVVGGGHFFVEDPRGGAFSGIYIYQHSSFPKVSVQLGDEVDVVGLFQEAFGALELSVRGDGEIMGQIDVVGSGRPIPDPVVVEPGRVATACDTLLGGADSPRYEGVRLQVNDVDVVDVDPCGLGSFGVFEVNDRLLIDDFAGMSYDPIPAEKLSIIRGVLQYTFDTYRLLPGPTDVVVD